MIEQITIKAFIGSNNESKQLEIDKIVSVVNKNHQAFTLDYPVIGYWRVRRKKPQSSIYQMNARR